MAEVVTFGCRLNAYESEVLKEKLKDIDNLIVINTCAVTSEAERQCRQAVRKLRRENPDAKIVVTGCSAQVSADKLAAMPEVDMVLGNNFFNYARNLEFFQRFAAAKYVPTPTIPDIKHG